MSERAQIDTKPATGLLGPDSTIELVQGVLARQSLLPNLVIAEQALLRTIFDAKGTVEPVQKLRIIRALIPGNINPGGTRSPDSMEPACQPNSHLLEFAMSLDACGAFIAKDDVDRLIKAGYGESSVTEVVAAVAGAQFLRTLARAFSAGMETPLDTCRSRDVQKPPQVCETLDRPYLEIRMEPDELKFAFGRLQEQFGFVPNLFRIQSYCPEIVKAEVEILDSVLFPEDHLSRIQKEQILLRVAARNCDDYLVTIHSQILNLFGIAPDECDQIIDHLDCAPISDPDRILLEETGKLSLLSIDRGDPFQCGRLKTKAFTEAQIIEAVVMAGFTNFLSTIQFGLGPPSDFPPRRVFDKKHLYPLGTDLRPNSDEVLVDPDSALVAQVKAGDTEAFADLVRQHTRRVFAVLCGMLGNADDARDSAQEVFLKAFQNIESFQGRSKFSTWITSIAVNTGTELLRRRKSTESLDDTDDEAGFRPRQLQSWVDDPEQQVAKAQVNDLVRNGVLRLPEKYRVALLLRDINQVPTEEAAAALNLTVPALKARVLRGRLMLRETLAPHFSRSKGALNV